MNSIWSQLWTQMPQLHFQRPWWLWALLALPLRDRCQPSSCRV